MAGDNCSMCETDWDDPRVEEQWCCERRQNVGEYLVKEGVKHGEIGLWPAWHIVPYVSLWAVESLKAPGQVGWWAISGDLPTDYISASTADHPRKALLAFADAWKEIASHMLMGVPHPDTSFGPPERNPEFASLLEKRCETLRRFSEDDSIWHSAEG